MLETLLADKLDSDSREYSYEFTLPIINETFGVLTPKLSFWFQLTLVCSLSMLFGVLLSIVVYKFIILKRKKGYYTALITNYVIVIPLCLLYPFVSIEIFGVQNGLLRFCFTLSPVTSMFRSMEALYDFSPATVETSMISYMYYSATVMITKFDKQTKNVSKVNFNKILYYLQRFLITLILMSFFLSFLVSCSYKPFRTNYDDDIAINSLDHSIYDMIDIGHLGNNFFGAIIFQSLLVTFGNGLRLITALLLGVETEEFMMNPVLKSSSPSDFWGKRWNLIIHYVLKGGVYKPVRKYFSKLIAAIAVFLTSGIFHEWMLSVIFYKKDTFPYLLRKEHIILCMEWNDHIN